MTQRIQSSQMTFLASRRRRSASALASVIALAGALLAAPVLSAAAPASAGLAPARTGLAPARTGLAPARTVAAAPALRSACPPTPPGYARCFTLYRPETAVNQAIADGISGRASRPAGLSPQAIESAYRLPVNRDSDQTVAVSIAFHTPHLAHYLAVYRQHYHLPPCTAASGCFREVNQHGKASPLPASGLFSGWDLEVTLDVSMISVACPHCRILVVEANDPGNKNLAETDNAAARLGAQVISNSYGQRENGFALADRKSYDHPGHVIVASSGDFGFTAANFPADLAAVVAVGGTRLSRARGARGWSERTWNDGFLGAGGSGCSAYVAKPAWQHDRHCPMRTVADVSAVATNVPIYNKAWGGWVTVAGTSISAPLIAGIYGLAGNAATTGPGRLYSHAGSLFDVTKGNNGLLIPARLACGDDYLCAAKKGYDAPTGMGTPDGIGAF
jgi:Subtilase family